MLFWSLVQLIACSKTNDTTIFHLKDAIGGSRNAAMGHPPSIAFNYKDLIMKITLTDAEQLIVNYVAQCRLEANQLNGSHKKPSASGMTALEIDQQGFGGEMAFCRAMNVFPDFTVTCRSAARGQDNGDCTVQGLTIDVKTSKKATGSLWVKEHKKGCADAYALVVGTFPTFTIIGLANHDMVFDDSGRVGDSFVVNQMDLITPEIFFSALYV